MRRMCRMVTPPPPERELWSRERTVGDSRKDSLVIMREDLQRTPGVYLITVASGAQVVSDFSLSVQRASAAGAPDLAVQDREALQQVAPLMSARIHTGLNSWLTLQNDPVPNGCLSSEPCLRPSAEWVWHAPMENKHYLVASTRV